MLVGSGSADNDGIGIIYEDDDLIVVRKPAGIAVQSGRPGEKDIVSELRKYLVSPYLGVTHRLDRQVEGLLVFGKNKKASGELSRQVREHIFNKRYEALCFVTEEELPREATLVDHIATDKAKNMSYISDSKDDGAKRAELDYEICEYIDATKESVQRIAYVKIDLHTGKHHQIRLQLSHAGLPIIGDRKYGIKDDGLTLNTTRPDGNMPALSAGNGKLPLCLAATELGFINPGTKERMSFTITPQIIEQKEKIIADL